MTDVQIIWLVIAMLAIGFCLGLGVAKVIDKLSTIQQQLEILPQISDRLKNVHEAIRSLREPRSK